MKDMSEEQAKQFLDQATQSLQGGQFQQALELVDQSIALKGDDAEAYILRGIALSQTGQPDVATESFRKAISLAHNNPKAYYNLAVHLYSRGQKSESLEMAREAVRLDTKHAGARDLVTRIEMEAQPDAGVKAPRVEEPLAPTGMEPPPGTGMSAPSSPSDRPPTALTPSSPYQTPPSQQPPGGYYRPGYETGGTQSLQFVDNMGKTWDTIGWALIGASLIVFVALLVLFMPLYAEIFRNPENMSRMGTMGIAGGGLSMVLQLVGYLAQLLSLVWMILELTNRRGNWLWLLPFILCCCCGFQWIPMGIYLLAGRAK